MKSSTAIEMQESATLNAGHGSAYRMCRLKRRKSITCPYRRRSVRFPRIPASSSASERSRHGSGWLCRTSRTVTTTNATMEIITKKLLLPLKDPNAAPVFVTLTRLKKSGTIMRASKGLINRRTSCFVHWSNAQSGSERKRMNFMPLSFRAE